jgi:hypothetical protein
MRNSENLDAWSGGGWGVFIGLNHQITVKGGCCRWAHRTVRCASHVTQPLGFGSSRSLEALSSSGTGQSSAAPDMHYSMSGVPLTSFLTSATHCSAVRGTVAVDCCAGSHYSTGAPDSPVNYSGVRLEKLESGQLILVRSWCTGHCPVAHRTVRCARPGHTRFLAPLYLNPIFNLLLVCVEHLCTCRSYTLEQTS